MRNQIEPQNQYKEYNWNEEETKKKLSLTGTKRNKTTTIITSKFKY